MEQNKKIGFEVIAVLLIVGNIFFAYSYFNTYKELQIVKSVSANTELNNKVIDFTLLFIKKVLQSEKEVDFETRLSLENSVRDLKDEAIMSEWQNFVASKTQLDAQNSVKKLLEILVVKIKK